MIERLTLVDTTTIDHELTVAESDSVGARGR
jgi:hypothetical protein